LSLYVPKLYIGWNLKHATTGGPKVEQKDLSPIVRNSHLRASFSHKFKGGRWLSICRGYKGRVDVPLTEESRVMHIHTKPVAKHTRLVH